MENSAQKAFVIRLNVNDGKIIFEALAELPFKYVYDLIGKLNFQANHNKTDDGDGITRLRHTLIMQELGLIIKALGGLPFNRVHRLVDKLSAQIQEQLNN
jgi:hypothetical protein